MLCYKFKTLMGLEKKKWKRIVYAEWFSCVHSRKGSRPMAVVKRRRKQDPIKGKTTTAAATVAAAMPTWGGSRIL